ncbi:MAG: hypothetical protein HY042_00800 [Spirochaetia bacterium]|nr:hypothetical protein [Spirochaetia bacterium]
MKIVYSVALSALVGGGLPGCLKVETNPLDSGEPLGFALLWRTAPASTFVFFTNTNVVLFSKGDGKYTAQTFSGISAGRLDAVVPLGRTLAGANSTDAGAYYSTDSGLTWAAASGVTIAAGTKTLKNCGGVLGVSGVSGLNLITASSTDAVNWTSASVGYTGPAVYGSGCHNGTFLLSYTTTSGPLTGTIGTAANGRNYSQIAVGGTVVPMGLASDGSTILAVDITSNYYTSSDGGATYSAAAPVAGMQSPWKSVSYVGGRFMAVFYNGTTSCVMMTYSGSWVTLPGGTFGCAAAPQWNAVATSGSTAIIAGTASSLPILYRSTDNGVTWAADTISVSGITAITDVVVLPP